MTTDELMSIIESIIYVCGNPIEIKDIIKIINQNNEENISRREIDYCIQLLKKKYNEKSSGLVLITTDSQIGLATKNENSKYVEDILSITKKKNLTQSAIEVLTIIAYNQPITKIEIEEIRGVKSDKIIQTLLEFNLIKEIGRLEKIGRPIIYGTTDYFLIHFGLKSIKELPKLP